MRLDEKKALLREVGSFHQLEDGLLTRIAERGEYLGAVAGTTLGEPGAESDGFEVVASGLFESFVRDGSGRQERRIATLRRSEIFGVTSMLTATPRPAGLRCLEAGEVLRYQGAAFHELLRSHPDIAVAVARSLAHRLEAEARAREVPLVSLASFEPVAEVVQKLPLPLIQTHRVLPVKLEGRVLTLAMVDPSDHVARNTVATFLDRLEPRWVCVTGADFDAFAATRLPALFQGPRIEEEEGSTDLLYFKGEAEVAPPAETPAAKLLDQLLKSAIDAGASDLDFEPDPDAVHVRARIDGRMTPFHSPLGFDLFKPLVSRVKVLSELNLAEKRLPQDASVRVGYRRRMLDLRISTLPTPAGEMVALRLLDPERRHVDLEDLIVDEAAEHLVADLMAVPSGLVLVTGPTGAGKTTTLYAGMRRRLWVTPTIKLVTAEDPVEYELEGVAQVQVNTAIGLTYARILRSLLRQNPDMLMIGEMRDDESLHIALEAALTGHAVLSSLHTNSALETLMRLRQRGAEDYVIGASLKGVVSQRLLPRLCTMCSAPVGEPEPLLAKLRRAGILGADEVIELKTAGGCDACRATGRKGRIGLYEVLAMSDPLREAVEAGAGYARLREVLPADSFYPRARYAARLLTQGLVHAEDLLPIFPVTKLRASEG